MDDTKPLSRMTTSIALAVVVVAVLAIGGVWQLLNPRPASATAPSNQPFSPSGFVGSETCAGCHQPEAKLWSSSQHKRAMDHATAASIKGDFSGVTFTYYGVQSRFFEQDGKYFVETDGPDGKLATFQVKYTFGVEPLQQYLVEFPDGRLQALSIAWDSRPKEEGGQRWFHLYPKEEIRAGDALHWTRLNQNWNFMCSECHSTGVKKNYDVATDRFATTWAEISVGCEGCHGQGSAHVAWARGQAKGTPAAVNDPTRGLVVRFDERNGVAWAKNPQNEKIHRSVPAAVVRKEVETCGLCHARRGQLSEEWVPGRSLSETHLVTPISRGLYYADGQIRDDEETYNYVPFKQSKMFAAGVTCSDCHEPHSAKLRRSGDNLCLGCHSDQFSSVAHHHHETPSPVPACIACHMPKRNYMVVDIRHDHGFRVPRPDISVKLGTPNPCGSCHADKSADWAVSAIQRWKGTNQQGTPTYADAFHSVWNGRPDAASLLAELVTNEAMPAVVRASGFNGLAAFVSPASLDLARAGLRDPDPMVRIGALDALEVVPGPQVWGLVAPLLSDPVRGVRIRAASLLASVPAANQPAADRDRFERAAAEFVAAQKLNADRPEARSTLATFYVRRGRVSEAEGEYRAALRLDPQFAPAAINLADLYSQTGRGREAIEVLRAAIASLAQNAALHHALGLALVRGKQLDQSLEELRRAAELDPGQARYAYVYAIALNSTGRRQDALSALKQNISRHSNDRDTLMAIISISRDAGDLASALEYAERLAKIVPGDRRIAAEVEGIRRQLQSAKPK